MLYNIHFTVKTVYTKQSIRRDFDNIKQARQYVKANYQVESIDKIRGVKIFRKPFNSFVSQKHIERFETKALQWTLKKIVGCFKMHIRLCKHYNTDINSSSSFESSWAFAYSPIIAELQLRGLHDFIREFENENKEMIEKIKEYAKINFDIEFKPLNKPT